MKCILCGRDIGNYNAEFNRLRIDESRGADICEDCIDRFAKWQGSKIVRMFPTRALKKRYGNNSA
jgi:hypothetical protein